MKKSVLCFLKYYIHQYYKQCYLVINGFSVPLAMKLSTLARLRVKSERVKYLPH